MTNGKWKMALLCVALGCLATTAHAHPVPFSYLDLGLRQCLLEGSLVAHIIDLAHELNVTPAEALLAPALAEAKKEAILNLLRPRLTLAADGRARAWELLRVEPLPDRQALALHL